MISERQGDMGEAAFGAAIERCLDKGLDEMWVDEVKQEDGVNPLEQAHEELSNMRKLLQAAEDDAECDNLRSAVALRDAIDACRQPRTSPEEKHGS